MLQNVDIQAMREEFKQSLRERGAKSTKVTNSGETFTDETTVFPMLYDSAVLATCVKKDNNSQPVGESWQSVLVTIDDEVFFLKPRSRKKVKYPDGPLSQLVIADANGTFEGKAYKKPVALLD